MTLDKQWFTVSWDYQLTCSQNNRLAHLDAIHSSGTVILQPKFHITKRPKIRKSGERICNLSSIKSHQQDLKCNVLPLVCISLPTFLIGLSFISLLFSTFGVVLKNYIIIFTLPTLFSWPTTLTSIQYTIN